MPPFYPLERISDEVTNFTRTPTCLCYKLRSHIVIATIHIQFFSRENLIRRQKVTREEEHHVSGMPRVLSQHITTPYQYAYICHYDLN